MRALVFVLVAMSLLLPGCGGGGGGSKVMRPAGQALDDWMRLWRGEVRVGQRPNAFDVPAPPVLDLPSVADDLGRNVDTAATDFSATVELAYEETKRVFCVWFGWYVETGHAIPSQEDFPVLLLRYGFGRVLTAPPSQQFLDAAELFRNSIARAQNEIEQVRNAAVAAACSAP